MTFPLDAIEKFTRGENILKWFKHYSDMHEGETISELFEQMGHQGLSFFLLQEICAEKLDKKPNESLTKSDCLFSFPLRNVRQKLRLSQKNLELLLNICQTKGQLSFEISENILKISMPILLDLLDSDSKKARQTRADAATRTRLDKEREKEKEEDKEKDISIPANFTANAGNSKSSKGLTSEQKDLNKRIWESYRDAYLLRYKVEPVRNATVNGQISMLRQRLGEEAIDVVSFYLGSNHSFYVGKCHPIGLCLNDAESLRTQMLKGTAITGSMVRNFEKQTALQETLDRIDKEGI